MQASRLCQVRTGASWLRRESAGNWVVQCIVTGNFVAATCTMLRELELGHVWRNQTLYVKCVSHLLHNRNMWCNPRGPAYVWSHIFHQHWHYTQAIILCLDDSTSSLDLTIFTTSSRKWTLLDKEASWWCPYTSLPSGSKCFLIGLLTLQKRKADPTGQSNYPPKSQHTSPASAAPSMRSKTSQSNSSMSSMSATNQHTVLNL